MKYCLSYSGTTVQNGGGNKWTNLQGPLQFNVNTSSADQVSLETHFGLATQPDSSVSFKNVSAARGFYLMSVKLSWAPNQAWSRPFALGVFTAPVNPDGTYAANTLLASQSYSYESSIAQGNTADFTFGVEGVQPGQALYLATGAYDTFSVKSYTVSFLE